MKRGTNPAMQLDLFETPLKYNEGESFHTCRRCKRELPISSFRVRSDSGRNGYRVKSCKTCEQKENQELTELHKKAPPVPDSCECCGKATKSHFMRLDHCHDTLKIRGGLVNTCTGGIAFLGDSIEGVEQALHYLRKHDERS